MHHLQSQNQKHIDTVATMSGLANALDKLCDPCIDKIKQAIRSGMELAASEPTSSQMV